MAAAAIDQQYVAHNKTDKFCASPAQNALVGMVMSGRAARACDVCGKERARWYCAADLAYLCQHCDGAVHSANAVASRHERTRLGADGVPVKTSRTPAAASANVKQEVMSPPHPSAHFNTRKRPRSIRRHKPSSFHASKHVISSSIHASGHNYVTTHPSTYTGSILESTSGVMIDNPRSNPDFIANINSNELLSKAFTSHVKAEPYSPLDIGDQVKVPDHCEDDHLLEGLFDFRDLQDDELFLHQVPVYNPVLHSQDSSPRTLNHCSAHDEDIQEYEEEKPNINITSPIAAASCEGNQCANFHSSHKLHQAEESKGLSPDGSIGAGHVDASSVAECDNGDDNMIDPNNDICDLDQLDFDCVLEANDEDSEIMDHASTTMDIDIDSHELIDEYPDQGITVDSGFVELGYNNHGSCKLDGDGDSHARFVAGIDFDASGSESPRTWLCKVKVESPSELGTMQGDGFGDVYDDTRLREKLTCKTLSAGSSYTFKLGLKLNFEEVLSSWSDKGTFWTDGHRPSQVDNCLDFLGGCFVPQMNGNNASEGEEQLVVPAHKNNRIDGGAREASVLRYREKRRTRLFSKKIRYEVRKLNAEKRPRMKGRFVKRLMIL